jgi:hypothetical protein
LEVRESGYILRTNTYIEFAEEKHNLKETLLEIQKKEDNYSLKLNEYKFNEENNIDTPNSTWFLLRKSFLSDKMNDYPLKEGDILRIGRITLKIKKIRFKKNKRKDKDKDSVSVGTNLQEVQIKTNRRAFEKEESKYKICRICYSEEESDDNPLIQPCICSGSMKYIHLECLKHWLRTSIFEQIENTNSCCIYLYKTPECELCKTKYPDFIRHNGKLYEIIDLQTNFDSYALIETITQDKNQNKYLYSVNLEQTDDCITIGRGHDCNLLLTDISVSRWHCYINIDKKTKRLTIKDNNSKFGTLILVKNRIMNLSLELKLCIQVGRTYLEILMKEPSSFFSCCGVSEMKNQNFYYLQSLKQNDILNKPTVKTEYDKDFYNILLKEASEKINLKTIDADKSSVKILSKENENVNDIDELISENCENDNNLNLGRNSIDLNDLNESNKNQ